MQSKKRPNKPNLQGVNEHIEVVFNAVAAMQKVFQGALVTGFGQPYPINHHFPVVFNQVWGFTDLECGRERPESNLKIIALKLLQRTIDGNGSTILQTLI